MYVLCRFPTTVLFFLLAGAIARPADTLQNPVAVALQPFVDRQVVAGAVSLVEGPDRTLSLEAVGFADLAGNKQMRTDSLFWIASMSKPITATAMMMLVDDGKLSLDDPVGKYLPEFRNLWMVAETGPDRQVLRRPKRPVTVRDLLTHTSGLVHFLDVEDMGSPDFELLPLREATRRYAMTPLRMDPGVKWEYCNAGFNTAGRIVEVVSGLPFEEFLSLRLFTPLGMIDTTFSPDKQQLERLAKGYRRNATTKGLEEVTLPLVGTLPVGRRNPSLPAGGLFSTANDLAKFSRLFLNRGEIGGRRLLSEATVRQMTGKEVTISDGQWYGLGWFSNADGSFGHNGAYATIMTIDPKRNRAIVLLVQHATLQADGFQEVNDALNAAVEKQFAESRN